MEADDVAPAPKKQVSEKVLANLAKAQARRKELYEQKLAQREQEKEASKKMKRVTKLRQQLVELVGEGEAEEKSESEVEEEMAPPVEVKKVHKAPPEQKKPVVKTEPKPVKERPIPKPPAALKPSVVYV